MKLTLLLVLLLLTVAGKAMDGSTIENIANNDSLIVVPMDVRYMEKQTKFTISNLLSPQDNPELVRPMQRLKLLSNFKKVTYADFTGSIDIFVDDDSIGRVRHIMVDRNSNGLVDDTVSSHSFYDIPRDVFDEMDNYQFDKYPSIRVQNGTDTTYVMMSPFCGKNNDKIEMVTRCYTVGSFMIDEKKINVHGGVMTLFYDDRSVYFFNFFDDDQKSNPVSYEIGDTIQLGRSLVKLEQYADRKLFLRPLANYCDSSTLNSILPQLHSIDLKSGEQICLNDKMTDKYVLIDFWGSWCKPCIAFMPKLKELYEKVKHRDDVLILGIATENNSDPTKLKAVVDEQGIEWQNVWNSAKYQNSLGSPQGKLKIQSYPTYVIVDKSAKIVFTSTDKSCENKDVIDRFLELINN